MRRSDYARTWLAASKDEASSPVRPLCHVPLCYEPAKLTGDPKRPAACCAHWPRVIGRSVS